MVCVECVATTSDSVSRLEVVSHVVVFELFILCTKAEFCSRSQMVRLWSQSIRFPLFPPQEKSAKSGLLEILAPAFLTCLALLSSSLRARQRSSAFLSRKLRTLIFSTHCANCLDSAAVMTAAVSPGGEVERLFESCKKGRLTSDTSPSDLIVESGCPASNIRFHGYGTEEERCTKR